MRASQLFFPTLREAPAEAEGAGHRLLVRAGFIRPVAAGVFAYLPLGRRALRKVEQIVREEMDAAGGQEVYLPALQPVELWPATGRWDEYGELLFKLRDRKQAAFVLGPTHEEVFTQLVARELRSYRQLPLRLYQIQTKFRDDPRPRGGLLRLREFRGLDLYSFDADEAGLEASYQRMVQACERILERCALPFVVSHGSGVVADGTAEVGSLAGGLVGSAEVGSLAGGLVGSQQTSKPANQQTSKPPNVPDSQRFVVPMECGEDLLLHCTACGYAANCEHVGVRPIPHGERHGVRSLPLTTHPSSPPLEKVLTPGATTVAELTRQLQIGPEGLVKTLLYVADGEVVAALVRGDRELNEERLRMALNCAVLEMADAPTVERVTNAPVGFAGPVGLNVPLLADPEVAAMADFVVGANEADTHFLHTHVGRDFAITRVVPLRFAVAGDGCPRCEGTLDAVRGLEVGHVCKVGTREVGAVPGARPLGAMFSDETGQRRPALKGGGGLDLSRLLAAVAERHHDEKGLRWPRAIAPFDVHLLLLDERKTVGAGLRASPSQAAEPGENVGAGLRASPSPTAEPGENVGAGLRASPLQAAEQLCAAFEQQGLEVLFDDRAERPGTKFHDADLIGLPVQVVVGRKWEQSGVVEVRARGTAAAEVLLAEVVRVVGELL